MNRLKQTDINRLILIDRNSEIIDDTKAPSLQVKESKADL